ncbi:MAG TPA: hypothetical protein VF472_11070 [Burkholderiaceae bacterium]
MPASLRLDSTGGYGTSALFLWPDDPKQRRWKLSVTVRRKPAPVLR